MTDDTQPAESKITIDADNILHSGQQLAGDAKKDAENAGHHGLKHLEEWFLAEVHDIHTYVGGDIAELTKQMKLLLARLARRL